MYYVRLSPSFQLSNKDGNGKKEKKKDLKTHLKQWLTLSVWGKCEKLKRGPQMAFYHVFLHWHIMFYLGSTSDLMRRFR